MTSGKYIPNPSKTGCVRGGSRHKKPEKLQQGFFIKRVVGIGEFYWNSDSRRWVSMEESTIYPTWELAYQAMLVVQRDDCTERYVYTIQSR